MSNRTKTIKGYLVTDWKKESIRARKTEPTRSELGSNELVGELEVEIVVPEVTTPDAAVTFEVPEPMVESAIAEALDDRSYPDWQKTAEGIIASQMETIEEAEDVENVVNGITIETLREARARPDITEVERYVRRSVKEIREDE